MEDESINSDSNEGSVHPMTPFIGFHLCLKVQDILLQSIVLINFPTVVMVGSGIF